MKMLNNVFAYYLYQEYLYLSILCNYSYITDTVLWGVALAQGLAGLTPGLTLSLYYLQIRFIL